MPGRGSLSLTDKVDTLRASERELLAEIDRLKREERYILLKYRQARDQVRYYESLLSLLRRDWGKAAGLSDLIRRLG
ncbi:MAG: hypothetical protein ABSB90_05460 [Thermoplasmata archaeon]|jgi:hypothetical protein